MKFMKWAFGAALALALSAAAIAANLPQVPSSASFSDPSQIVGTLNQWSLYLSGQPNAMGTPATAGNFGLGTYCTASGATPQTCNGSRGQVSFTNVTAAGNTNATAQVINNSMVTAASACTVTLQVAGAGGSGPVVTSAVPGAGTLTVVISNATATTTGSFTPTLAFQCFN